jgi:hypothetical protein
MVNKITISETIENLSNLMKNDPDYAWTWLCNIAVCAQDEGLEYSASNRCAANFIKALCGLDMTNYKFFIETQKNSKNLINEKNYEEICTSAFYLWKKFYYEKMPNWKPAKDVLGVLEQIDEMIEGL